MAQNPTNVLTVSKPSNKRNNRLWIFQGDCPESGGIGAIAISQARPYLAQRDHRWGGFRLAETGRDAAAESMPPERARDSLLLNLLLISSSLFDNKSRSTQIAGEFVDAWRRTHPGTAAELPQLTW